MASLNTVHLATDVVSLSIPGQKVTHHAAFPRRPACRAPVERLSQLGRAEQGCAPAAGAGGVGGDRTGESARAVQKLIGAAEVNRGWFGDDMIGHGQGPPGLVARGQSDGRRAGPRD